MDIVELKIYLNKSWKRETCSQGLRSEWSEENPSLGQCAITSLIVNNIYGGKIMRCMASSGSHYYNEINDELVDLTVEQFLGETPQYEEGQERTKEYLLGNEDTRNRFLLLNKNLREVIEKEKNHLVYLNYDNLDINEELSKIENSDTAEIILEPSNKKCLLILGMLFAHGVKIKILNESTLNFEDTNKSFTMMPYVWSKLGDENFPAPDYSNVVTEMDNRIENVKRLGVTVEKIKNNPIENKHFIICPVRNAKPEQRKWIEDYFIQMYNACINLHAPHLNTRQIDLFGGYAICKQNAEAIATSSVVDLFYDQSSTGSVFDLGVAYALHKPLNLLNRDDIIFDESSVVDKMIENWPYYRETQLSLTPNN